MVWIGPGWPIFDTPDVQVSPQQQGRFFSTIVGLSSELEREDIRLYAVDPLGTADAASSRTFLWESFTKPVTKPGKGVGALGQQRYHRRGCKVRRGCEGVVFDHVRSGPGGFAEYVARCSGKGR